MGNGFGGQWIADVARRAELDGASKLSLSGDISVADAWHEVSRAAGIDEVALAEHVAKHFRLELADLAMAEPRVLKLVPESFARRHTVLPLRESDREIVIATCNPADLEAEQALGFAAGRTPIFEIAPPSILLEAIDSRYSPNKLMENILEGIRGDSGDEVVVLEGAEDSIGATEVDTGPVVKLANLIIRDGVREGASDIHLEPGRNGGIVRFRVDGVLRRYMRLPMPALTRVVSRIKVTSGLDIADHLRPQDGRARVVIERREYDLRISTVPTRDAEKAVIRILNPAGTGGLADAHLPAPELERLKQVLTHRDGIVIVSGPTGSGKTTTLYSALHDLSTEEVNIMTVEDPVEYEMAGITQIQVEPHRNVTFASALRAILRQDPDVILVGEIRDLETAKMAVQASMTGHLVLATLHTNNAVGVVQRLVDLGLDRPSIAESLRAALAQRLVRRVCSECSEPVGDDIAAETPALAKKHGVEPMVKAVGCTKCGQMGYRGRLPIAEVLVVNSEIRELIVRGATGQDLARAAVASGMRPLADVAREPVGASLTTIEEIERVLGERDEASMTSDSEIPHILLVDDDTVNRTLARTLLEKNGFKTSEAEDGIDALEKLDEGSEYSLVVLDLDMPRLGGREVLQRIRGSVRTAGLPVVVLTGTRDEESEVELLELGADDYIRKPINPPRFLTRIKATLRRAGA